MQRQTNPRQPGVMLSLLIGLALLAMGGGVSPGAMAGTTEQRGGKSPLIGILEGPEVVTDSAQFPNAFSEAPPLAVLVKVGKLPPVAERIGRDPMVIKPVHEIGKYGGIWRRGFTGPADVFNGFRAAMNDKILYFDYTGTTVVPNLARGWELSDDGRMTTIFLRRAMKWSDGYPFTADDFLFWYEDMYQNKDLVPTTSPVMTIAFKPVVLEKVDTHTVRFRSPEPYYLLPEILAAVLDLGGHARWGRLAMGGFAPAHYLKQFHPKYVSKEELDRKVKDAKVDNWVALFKFKNDSTLNPELPVVTPWKTASPINTPTWVLERNPYFYGVDTAGNQLPYIDKLVLTLAENLEVINLRAIAGEYDKQARHIDLQKLPVLLENQQRGGYRVYLDPSDQGTDVALWFNMSYEADPEVAKWIANTDFRRALSLGIDRDQLNETFWLGLGVPGAALPGEGTLYNPGPEYRARWATYELQQANTMLDAIGLDKKDAEGYRLRTDGKGRLRIEIQTFVGFFQFTQVCEMIREQWKKIGIQADLKEVERSLAWKRRDANEHQIYVDAQWGSDNMFGHIPVFFPYDGSNALGPLYGRWFASGGRQGKEPPARMRELMAKYRQAFGVPFDARVKLAKEIWTIAVDEVWTIGTVGLSPGIQGVRVAKTNMGNLPARQWVSAVSDNPQISHPETFYFK
jgi:peptide/nickel transport system substrate-binding protein